jgi:hypothetical protein
MSNPADGFAQISFRVPAAFKTQLAGMAAGNKRSLTGEICIRLEQSISTPAASSTRLEAKFVRYACRISRETNLRLLAFRKERDQPLSAIIRRILPDGKLNSDALRCGDFKTDSIIRRIPLDEQLFLDIARDAERHRWSIDAEIGTRIEYYFELEKKKGEALS